MKRGRKDKEQEVVPRKKKMETNMTSKLLFKLVLPYLFPGFYGEENFLAFRTFLALAGTCKRLRNWEQIRRWIGYLAPIGARDLMIEHNFPIRLWLAELRQEHGAVTDLLHLQKDFTGRELIVCSSFMIRQGFEFGTHGLEDDYYIPHSDFDISISGIPFFNSLKVYSKRQFADDESNCLTCMVYLAPSFAEMVLFCYAAMSDRICDDKYYMCVPLWKAKDGDFVFFSQKKRETYLQKALLGKLRKIGNTAPLDNGFTTGKNPHTAFSYFMEECDTSGSKTHTSPASRLAKFVTTWFKQHCFPLTESEKPKYELLNDEPFFY